MQRSTWVGKDRARVCQSRSPPLCQSRPSLAKLQPWAVKAALQESIVILVTAAERCTCDFGKYSGPSGVHSCNQLACRSYRAPLILRTLISESYLIKQPIHVVKAILSNTVPWMASLFKMTRPPPPALHPTAVWRERDAGAKSQLVGTR